MTEQPVEKIPSVSVELKKLEGFRIDLDVLHEKISLALSRTGPIFL
jgi:hypothetical protein